MRRALLRLAHEMGRFPWELRDVPPAQLVEMLGELSLRVDLQKEAVKKAKQDAHLRPEVRAQQEWAREREQDFARRATSIQ